MRNLFILSLIMSTIFLFIGCGGNNSSDASSSASTSSSVQQSLKQDTSAKKPSTQQEQIEPAICPKAGLGDSKEWFSRSLPGKYTDNRNTIYVVASENILAMNDGTHVINLDIGVKSTGKIERINPASVKNYFPDDAVMVRDAGMDNDSNDYYRWWCLYHSDKLAKRIPESHGDFVVIQVSLTTGEVSFTVAAGSDPN